MSRLSPCATFTLIRTFLLFCACLLWAPTASAAIDGITLVLSEEGGAYADFSNSLSLALDQTSGAKINMRVVPLAKFNRDDFAGATRQLLLAVGSPAMNAMAQKPPRIPVLNVLVPRSGFQKSAHVGAKTLDSAQFSAVFLDQPWARQFALISQALPGRQRVGILLGKESAEFAGSLQGAARDASLSANIELVQEEADLFPALKRLLAQSDVLLAVPDALIYNRNNITSILLTSYRAQIPLFGFSAAYVKAGALAAVYSQPAQIATQVAEILHGLPPNGNLPAPQPPRYFSISINHQVKRSLGLDIDDEQELLRKLKPAAERVP